MRKNTARNRALIKEHISEFLVLKTNDRYWARSAWNQTHHFLYIAIKKFKALRFFDARSTSYSALIKISE